MDPNSNEFAAFETRILLTRMSKEILDFGIKDICAQQKVGAKIALRIMFSRFVGDLVGFSFPVNKISPDKEDLSQRQDYENLPRFVG